MLRGRRNTGRDERSTAIALVCLSVAAACTGEIEVGGAPPCQSDAECETGRCLAGPNGNACYVTCHDQDECTEDQSCSLLADPAGEPVPVCIAAHDGFGNGAGCVENADCRSRLCAHSMCVELCTSCDGSGLCTPDTFSWNGQDVTVDTCQWQMGWSIMHITGVDTPLGGSDFISFRVPEAATSFDIVLIDDDGLRVAVKSLTAPDGTVLIDIDDANLDLNPGFSYPTIAVTAVPSTDDPRAQVQRGEYHMHVGTYDPLDFADLVPMAGDINTIEVYVERAGAEGGLLDLNLLLAPATGLTAATAAEQSFVTDMLATIQSLLLDPAMSRLGNVTFRDLTTAADVIDSGDAIRALLATQTDGGPNGVSVNVILTSDITFTSGYSAGIPGAPGFYDTPGSGLVVELLGTGTESGIVVAHELGHFLGLKHTTELTLGRHDPILDTPECASGTEVTGCPDYNNLMFPMFPLSTSLELTPGQRLILRKSLSLYQVTRPNVIAPPVFAYDITDSGFATGNTHDLDNDVAGSCGGGAGPERVQLLRVEEPAPRTISISVLSDDFAPVVYVFRGHCGHGAAELACETGTTSTPVTVTLTAPEPAPYFIVVDSADATGGNFRLQATTTP